MKRAIAGTGAFLAAAIFLVGCTAQEPAPESSASSVPTSTPTESAEALPAVSLATTCGLLFGSNVDGPIARATDIVSRFVETPDLTTVSEDEIASTINSLDTAAKNSDEAVKPYIEAQTDVLQQLLDAMTNNANSSIDFADYKASGLELINQCEPYL